MTPTPRTIWKFPVLNINGDEDEVSVPIDARLVHFGPDPDGAICAWFECDRTDLRHRRWFAIYGTGWPIPAGQTHVGSYVEGPFLWHVYISDFPPDFARGASTEGAQHP